MMKNLALDVLYVKEKRLNEHNIDRFAKRFFTEVYSRKRKLEKLETRSLYDKIELEVLKKSDYIVRELRYACMLSSIFDKDQFRRLLDCIILELSYSVMFEFQLDEYEKMTKAKNRCVTELKSIVEETLSTM